MSYRLLFILALLVSAIQIQAADNQTKENRFYDRSTEQFVAVVGQFASRTGYIHFADAELPPDPNTPVDRGFIDPGIDLDFDGGGIYSVSIDGDDSEMFIANITMMSASENGCTVHITYHPTSIGTHHARLVAYCSNAGSPYTYVNLCGQGVAKPGDVDGDGRISISDISTLIDMLLNGE